MQGYVKAVQFVKALAQESTAIKPQAACFEEGDYRVNADLYKPEETPEAVILFVHGMTPYGHRDPRMVNLGRAAAASRYLAIVPDYALIRQGLLDVSSVTEVVATVRSIINDKSICPQGKLAIFTASFSGSICIRAVSDATINEHVTSLMIVGGCNSPAACFHDILATPDQDPYAKLILLKNFTKEKIANDIILERAMACAIEDAYLNNNKSTTLHHYLVNLSLSDRERVNAFLRPVLDNENVIPHYKSQIKSLHDAFMNTLDLDNIHCKVALVHSATDQVILPSETENLYQELQRHGVDSRMLVTSVLEHAGFSLSLKFILGSVKLVKIFAYFFAAIIPE